MLIDRKLIEDGYITERKHKDYNYFIYNYTAKAQYDRVWNETTLICRGLILDSDGRIVARPFKKFFNLEEYSENSFLGKLPKYKQFSLYDKMDGSLGILYSLPNNELCLATRGSFHSEQAIKGTEILNRLPKATLHALYLLSETHTFLFEIVYPENRIVVDYGNQEDIILLAVIHKETGAEWGYDGMQSFCARWNISLVKHYGYRQDNLDEIKAMFDSNNKEGFVIRFDNGLRVKLKFEEYKRLHRLLTNVSTKNIWELLKNNESIDILLERVPDEFYQWVKRTIFNLKKNFTYVEKTCLEKINTYPTLTEANNRGILSQVASQIAKDKHSAILFAMWRNKEYNNIIWRFLEPKYSKPFKEEKE